MGLHPTEKGRERKENEKKTKEQIKKELLCHDQQIQYVEPEGGSLVLRQGTTSRAPVSGVPP